MPRRPRRLQLPRPQLPTLPLPHRQARRTPEILSPIAARVGPGLRALPDHQGDQGIQDHQGALTRLEQVGQLLEPQGTTTTRPTQVAQRVGDHLRTQVIKILDPRIRPAGAFFRPCPFYGATDFKPIFLDLFTDLRRKIPTPTN